MHSDMELTTLKNGLRVMSVTRTHTETVTIGIWVKTGSAYEKVDVNGISHFLEHMAFKGTKRRTAMQISEEIEDVGGQLNAYTSQEFTAYYAKMLKEDTELAIDVLADIVQHSTFPEAELIKEREVVVQEIKQSIDTPDDIIFDYFQNVAFPDQAIGRSILGPVEKVRSFDKKTLTDYIKTNYAAENMVVCAVGNITHEQLLNMVEKRLCDFKPKNLIIPENQIYVGGQYVEKRDIEQAHVLLGFDGFDYCSEYYYPCLIFSTLFGGGMSSRLFQEIREKRGLVYTVYSFGNSHSHNGLFGIYAGTGKEELKTLMPVVCEEIKKVRQEKVLEKELLRAKSQLKASLLMAIESSSSTAEVMARQMLLFDRIIPTHEMIEKVENVNLDDIQNVANKVFESKPTYTLLGSLNDYLPYEDIEKLIRV